ncbi:MAG TPA: FtsX-like permease family protein [Bacillota bacterium]
MTQKGQAFEIPVALNLHGYVQIETDSTVQRLNLKGADYSNPSAVAEIIGQKGGVKYLDSLPGSQVLSLSLDPSDYQEAFYQGLNTAFGPGRYTALLFAPPGSVAYQPAPDLLGQKVLAAVPVGINITVHEPVFRKPPDKPTEANILFKLTGTFDIEKLGPESPGGLAVPADNYVPPLLTMTHDAAGRPLAKPRTLRPNGDPYSYIQEPPLMLTTMQAARLIAGDTSISSVRVRVAGIDQYSPEAQQKLERVAAEIVRRTGLHVTITAGASAEKTLVFLPGFGSVPAAGYIEEWWTKAGVNVEVRQRIQWENLVFFLIVLAVAGLYVGNTAMVTTLQKQGELGLLKALGWTDGSVAGRVLMQFFGPALLAGLLGVLLSQGVAWAGHLRLSFLEAAMVLPASLLVALFGIAAGLGVARRATPILALRRGDVRVTARRRGRAAKGSLGLWGLAWSGLAGRPGTTTVNVIVTAVADGFLILLVSLLTSTRGYLRGTLLGRYILLHVETYHLAMAVVALMVAAVAAADSALLGVIRRRAQLGLLAATGWTPPHRFRLVLAEGIILGVMGAFGGLLLGTASTLAVTQGRLTLSKALASGGPSAAVPLIIVPLAALGAAWRASRLAPGPALRDE